MKAIRTSHEGREGTLRVIHDAHGTPQIYLFLEEGGSHEGQGILCHGWGVRKGEDGLREGVLVQGGVMAIPREDWLEALREREDARDRLNLPNLHLVKVYSRGNRITLDGYALNARVDRATWQKISSFMEEVDSTVNDEILEGDHFIGWMVKEGMEQRMEQILGVKKEKTLEARKLLPAGRP